MPRHLVITAILASLLLGILCTSTARAQTGPDIAEIQRHAQEAEAARQKDRKQVEAREHARAATQPTAERVRALENEVAARPTVSEAERLRNDNATLRAEAERLRAELAQAQAMVRAMGTERDALRAQLELLNAAKTRP